MKRTLLSLCAFAAVSFTAAGCSSDVYKQATEVMEQVAAEAEKAQGDCEKFAAAVTPIATKNAELMAKMAAKVKEDKEAAMKKLAEYGPRMAAVRTKLRPIKSACRKHPAASAAMKTLQGRQ